MRLVCPNCGAQYEIDGRVIPDTGRDVQCSNCGHTWFQRPVGAEAPEAPAPAGGQAPGPEETARAGREPAETGADTAATEPDTAAEPAQPTPQAEADAEAGQDAGTEAEAASPAPAEPPTTPRPTLDESLQAVLREEAEREARARARERQEIETQGDLGLDASEASDRPAASARERMARLRGLDTEEETHASGGAGARRDLLPDIEEINSSLTSIGADEVVDDFAEPAGRGGFARGFFLMLLLAALAVALYLYAPLIGERLPALAGPLDAYMGTVDGLRGWLDEMVQRALSQ